MPTFPHHRNKRAAAAAAAESHSKRSKVWGARRQTGLSPLKVERCFLSPLHVWSRNQLRRRFLIKLWWTPGWSTCTDVCRDQSGGFKGRSHSLLWGFNLLELCSQLKQVFMKSSVTQTGLEQKNVTVQSQRREEQMKRSFCFSAHSLFLSSCVPPQSVSNFFISPVLLKVKVKGWFFLHSVIFSI